VRRDGDDPFSNQGDHAQRSVLGFRALLKKRPPGARRIESTGKMDGVQQVAFENPDGQKVLVVTNAGPAGTASINQGGRTAEVSLVPDSVTTLVWN